jgi:hypothetical protein
MSPDLYMFLALAFGVSERSRAEIAVAPPETEKESLALLTLLVPSYDEILPGYPSEVLFGALWELSRGDWAIARYIVTRVADIPSDTVPMFPFGRPTPPCDIDWSRYEQELGGGFVR